MDRREIRLIVLELLQELTYGINTRETERSDDGEEWNVMKFDGELFVERIAEWIRDIEESYRDDE